MCFQPPSWAAASAALRQRQRRRPEPPLLPRPAPAPPAQRPTNLLAGLDLEKLCGFCHVFTAEQRGSCVCHPRSIQHVEHSCTV